jgi:hypothetical protein
MPKIQYISKRFNSKRTAQIHQANAIIAEYAAQGFELTLRQLYYQFVARGLLENKQSEYKNLGETINDARLAGLVDWDAIVDRTRHLRGLSSWESPEEIIGGCAHSFHLDHWADQPFRLEVWIEKDALVGVIQRVCNRNDVDFFSCRGYTSQSELWRAARRLAYYAKEGKEVRVIHLGDHDPSGIDMSRDIQDRIEMFAAGRGIELRRIALNMPQVEQYNPPPNPAKESDSRCDGYVRQFGDQSWELDALEPSVIEKLIQAEVDEVLDKRKWDACERREKKDKELIGKVAANWKTVVECVEEL